MLFFFKQKTAYELRISDWSSDVCSSDLAWRQSWRLPSSFGIVEAPPLAAGAGRSTGSASNTININTISIETYRPFAIPPLVLIGRRSLGERGAAPDILRQRGSQSAVVKRHPDTGIGLASRDPGTRCLAVSKIGRAHV